MRTLEARPNISMQNPLDTYDVVKVSEQILSSVSEQPPAISEFVKGSYFKQLDSREWIVTQDNGLSLGEGYGVYNPMAMRAWDAPGSGVEGRRIKREGTRPDEALPTDREITIGEAKKNFFAFAQLYGRQGSDHGGDVGTVSCYSQGLAWDRQTAYEEPTRDMVRAVAGNPEAPIVWFGPRKAVIFIENDKTPEEMATRMNLAPREAYRKHLPNLSGAQEQIQDRRLEDFIDVNGKARKFAENFRSGELPLERAYQDDGGLSFSWKYDERDGQLIGINPDNEEQSMISLAEKGYEQDTDMKNKIAAINKFMKGAKNNNRYVVEINFDIDVACCNFSSNAQQEAPQKKTVFSNSQIAYESKVSLGKPGWDEDKDERLCDGCGQKSHGGQCAAMEEHVASE